MWSTLREHYPEYCVEAVGLSLFMISAALCTILLEHPRSPVHESIADPVMRRLLIGIAMGMTAVGIIYSPWGQRSGAHLNPAVTLTFFRLGKIHAIDAVFYVLAQFIGGVAGVMVVAAVLGMELADQSVNYVATVPGQDGPAVAFLAEFAISFVLMGVVLIVSNARRFARYTGLLAGLLVATYISVEAPLSGMSMNPARTLGSALPAQVWTSLWIYFTAPPIGMLLAGECYVWLKGAHAIRCAKLHHQNDERCIFVCGYAHEREHEARGEGRLAADAILPIASSPQPHA